MTDPVITFAEARTALSLTAPPGARARVLAAVLEPRRRPVRRPVRAPILVFALFVSATAAAVGGPPLVRWSTRALALGTERYRPSPAAPNAATRVGAVNRRVAPVTPSPAVSPEPAPAPVTSAPPEAPPVAPPKAPPAPDNRRVPDTRGTSESTPLEQPGDSALAQEVAAYREAAALVATSPGLAIVRLRAHREHFPQSALGEEVSLRLVQAFAALGRSADARREAQSFVVRYPQSAKYQELRAIADGAPVRRPEE